MKTAIHVKTYPNRITYQARFWFYTWYSFSEGLYCKKGEDTFDNIDDCKKFIDKVLNRNSDSIAVNNELIKYP